MRASRLKRSPLAFALLGQLLMINSAAADPVMMEETIPPLVTIMPFPPAESETDSLAQGTFTLVATNVPLDELLPALARKAGLNLDQASGLQGSVTLNLTNRPLRELLEQIERQTGMRAQLHAGNILTVTPGNLLATRPVAGQMSP
ncbi:MAG: hypothetical protein HQL91_10690 [Magnetococcales bacterium]|nr:hypothetical protein [Magnetococcales bacterium]